MSPVLLPGLFLISSSPWPVPSSLLFFFFPLAMFKENWAGRGGKVSFWRSPDCGYDGDRQVPPGTLLPCRSVSPSYCLRSLFYFPTPPVEIPAVSDLDLPTWQHNPAVLRSSGFFFSSFGEGKMLALSQRFPFSQTLINHWSQTCASKASHRLAAPLPCVSPPQHSAVLCLGACSADKI